MNRQSREIWLVLSRIDLPKRFDGALGLCNLCRYAEFSGSWCEDSSLECHCGIERIEEDCFDVWAGSDCWAFRPKYSFEDTVDMVGVFLQGSLPDMGHCKRSIPKKMQLADYV